MSTGIILLLCWWLYVLDLFQEASENMPTKFKLPRATAKRLK